MDEFLIRFGVPDGAVLLVSTLLETALGLAVLGILYSWLTMLSSVAPSPRNRTNFRPVHRRNPYVTSEFRTELTFVLINTLIFLPLGFLQRYLLVDLVLTSYVPSALPAAYIDPLPGWLRFVAALVLLDVSLYVRHRFVHRFAWPYHTVHHAAREISWLTWARLHPGDRLIMGVIEVAILHVLTFDAVTIAGAAALRGHVNQFNHANLRLDYGFPLRYVFVSPNMHRWHHATEPEALNKNFAIMFSWIDLLFGTFYVPADRLPERYGVEDAKGLPVVGPGYVEQMLYPLHCHARQFARWRTKFRTSPNDAAEPNAGR